MFNIFENRNKDLAKVLKIGQLLGRSLRENVELLSFNASDNLISYLTESKKVITGKIANDSLIKIKVKDADDYLKEEKFDKEVEQKISVWLGNIYENNYTEATSSFDSILDTWTERSKIAKAAKVLESKKAFLEDNKRIMASKEFSKLEESKPVLIKFLKENKKKVQNVAQIANGVILANTVAHAFAVPKLSYEKLTEAKSFDFYSESQSGTLFDLIAKQELIRTELLESKRSFDSIWNTNEKVIALANAIRLDSKEVATALAEAIHDVPYLALVSKKQLTEMFNSILNEGEEVVSIKDIQKYSSYIFEAKKQVKEAIIETLNEKYGINIQTIQDPITYKSLLNTQVVVFESIRRLTPKESVLRPVLKDFINLLKESNGIEAVDVNEFLHDLFVTSGYTLVNESVMTRYLNFAEIANDLGSVAQVLRSLQAGMGGEQNPAMAGGAPQAPMGQPAMGGGMPAQSPMAKPGLATGAGQPQPQMPMGGDASEDDLDQVGMTPEDDEMGMEPEMGGGLEGQTPPVEMGGGQLMASIAELEELINGLKVKLGDDTEGMDMPVDGMPEEEGEFGGEEGFPEGGEGDEEGDINIDTGEGDDEVHVDDVDDNAEHDTSDDEEPEEKPKSKSKEAPPKKEGKDKPSKDKKPMPKKGKE